MWIRVIWLIVSEALGTFSRKSKRPLKKSSCEIRGMIIPQIENGRIKGDFAAVGYQEGLLYMTKIVLSMAGTNEVPILNLNLIPQNQICSKQKSLNSPSILSLSSSPLTISVALPWTLSSTSISLLYQETKYSQFGLLRAQQMGKQLAGQYKDILMKTRKQAGQSLT